VALLAAVALLVWLLTAGGGTPVQGHAPSDEAKSSVAAETAQAPAPTTPEQPAPTAQREVAKEPVTGPVATVRVVTFGTKAPVAGAHVHYQPPSFNWRTLPLQRSQELSKLASLDNELLLQQIGVEVVTDADGQCVVPVGPMLGTQLCVRAGDLFGLSYARPDMMDPQEVVLRRDRTLHVLVLDANDAPVPGINVQAASESEASAEAAGRKSTSWPLGTSDAAGRYEQRHVQLGAREAAIYRVQLAAMPPGGLGPAVAVDLAAPPPEVVLHLPATGSLTVHVRDSNGHPIDPAFLGEPTVRLAAFEHPPADLNEKFDALSRQQCSAAIDANGDAEFPRVGLGRHLLLQQGWSGDCKGVEGPTQANPHVEATLQESAKDVILVGVLLRPDGSPLAKERPMISCRAGGSFGLVQIQTGSDGRMRYNAGGHFAGATSVIALETDPALRDNPLALQLPPHALTAGINDLGELHLEPKRVLVAGRLVCDAGIQVRRVSLTVERRESRGWTQVPNLRPDWQDDGTFSVRSGIPSGEPLRLAVGAGPYLPVEPIECKAGDSAIEIRLHAAGAATATFLVDERTPTDRMFFRFRRTTPPQDLDDSALMRERFAGTSRSPSNGRLREQWTGLSPGAYQLSVVCQGVDAPIVSIDGIDVGTAACTDPRLQDIDLRGRARILEIRASGAGGAPLVDAKAYVVLRSDSEQWFAKNLGDGAAQIATASAISLYVLAPGYRMAAVEGVTESSTIPLQPAETSRVHVQLPSPLPEGVELRLRLQPMDLRHLHASILLDNGRGTGLDNFFVEEIPVGVDGMAKVPVRWPGEYTVVATVATSGRGGNYVYDLEPRTITLPATQEATVRVGQKGFDAALERLRK
jgi:hypothetical protein